MIDERLCDKQYELFSELRRKDKTLIFWGCGENASDILPYLLKNGIVPECFCDKNADKIGNFLGYSVCTYEEIKRKYRQYVIVLLVTICNAVQIKKELLEAGESNPIYVISRPFKVDTELLSEQIFHCNLSSYQKVYDMLEDDLSRKLMYLQFIYKLTGDAFALYDEMSGDSFFDEVILPCRNDHVYVDVGAYTGDTVIRFYAFARGKYEKIYAIEPDKGNYSAMEKLVEYSRLDNVDMINKGGWNQKDELTFHTVSDDNYIHFDSPSLYDATKNGLSTVFDKKAEEHHVNRVEIKIEVDSVDNILDGRKATLIKINAVAADFPVLEGCKKTIKEYHPSLVIEYGTLEEGLWKIPLMIHDLWPHYKMYLRQKYIFGDSKTVLYAVADDI